MEILDTIQSFSEILSSFNIIEFLEDERVTKSKVKVTLRNNSVLWIREVGFKDQIISYSYYWLRSDNSIIIGWDNAPHHQDIETFPHHKHIGKNIEPSQETSLEHVLTYISKFL